MEDLPMCGIFAYCGRRQDAAQLTWQALNALEYRGYDSWGITCLDQGRLVRHRAVGPVSAQLLLDPPAASLAIGHTRWATHGGVSETNAHPHQDCHGRFAVVHNGIFENDRAIRAALRGGHELRSETDTELLAHLVEELIVQVPFPEAARQAFLQLEGLNAAVVCDAVSGSIVALRNGSPLSIGLGDQECFVSSDLNTLAAFAREVALLEDGECAEITPEGVRLYALDTGKALPGRAQPLAAPAHGRATRGDFAHFLLKEIHEQPQILDAVGSSFAEEAAPLVDAMRSARHRYLVGCGTGAHAALLGAQLLADVAGVEAIPVVGSELAARERLLDDSALVLYLSQSGETVDLLESLRRIRRRGATTASLVNVPQSSLHRLVQIPLLLHAGPEISVASTKAFMAKIACLALLAHALADDLSGGLAQLNRARDALRHVLATAGSALDVVVSDLVGAEHCFVIGRGYAFPVALEAALKMKELSYLHVEGLAAGELKHGTLALIEEGTPCIVYAPRDATWPDTRSAIQEIRARGGRIIGVSSDPDELFDDYIPVPDIGRLTVMPQVAVAQLLAYRLAVAKHRDPDRPRNLAKSVTVK
jgi:glucosamine--fructose-6-phosphate aminotransferase (isomerizing)